MNFCKMVPSVSENRPQVQTVRAVTRSLAILNSFAGKKQQSLAEVSQSTGLDKGTTRRILLTLMNENYVAQDAVTQHYRLGQAIRELASNVEDAQDLRSIAQPTLLALASDLGVTVFLSVYQDGDAVCLDRVHDMRGIEVHWWAIGGTMPLNCGGAPKVLLAHRSETEIEKFLTEPLQTMNGISISDSEELRARLSLIRKQGYECAKDDVAVGMTALAVPVLDAQGVLVCVVSIAGLTPQLISKNKPVHLLQLRQAAQQIRSDLGIRPAG